MTKLNNRVTLGEGTAEPDEIGLAGERVFGTRSADGRHRGSALRFQTTDLTGGELLVRLAGEIDASNSSWLLGRLTTAITDRTAASAVVVDLTGINFCDASGISVLVNALKRCRGHQIALELAGAHGRVARILRLTGVDRDLPLHADLDGALHAITGHRPAPWNGWPGRAR
ncbi:STAS domain-containing protein [Actinomadura terrae]|uniref:STAS domain-containing protein n=1 Tax=Actinomadura terrae TaxID=604353 RepID=UPI001FA6E553|nr:STAS domain-containing protein [Actinomadura terrae]